MENLDVMVLRTLRDWRAAGKRALLATVVRTWGSSPRPVGSIMALCENGALVGSVSGGCIEDDLVYRHTKVADQPMPSGAPGFVKYGITADEAHRFGLPCGGTLELLLEYDPDAANLAALVQALEAGSLMQRHVRLSDGVASLSQHNCGSKWVWMSMNPGVSTRPAASISCSPAARSAAPEISAMRPSRTPTLPERGTEPVPSTIRALRITRSNCSIYPRWLRFYCNANTPPQPLTRRVSTPAITNECQTAVVTVS